MTEREGGEGEDMVSFRELARRLVRDGVVKSITHQRISQIHAADQRFPRGVQVGRTRVVSYTAGRRYFEDRVTQQGRRTDREAPPAE